MFWLAAPADARTIRSALGDAQEAVHIRPAPAFTAFADHFVTLATDLAGPRATTAALAGPAIDSSMSPLGPIFLDHAETLGAGQTNVNVIGAQAIGDGLLWGQNFAELGQGNPGLTVLRRTPTGDPNAPVLTGVRLGYQLDLKVRTVAIALNHGVTDQLDLSLVVPIVWSRLDCRVTADVRRQLNQDGEFVRVPDVHLEGQIRPVDSTGLGDLVLRAKYALGVPLPWRLALTLEGQFPTGDHAQVHGSGSYWLTPGVNASRRFGDRAEVSAHAALAFNVSDTRRSQADYGLSGSVMLWPRRLALVAEFLGRSQLDEQFTPVDSNVLTYVGGAFVPANLLGVNFGRRVDVFDFAFGIRLVMAPWLVFFAAGALPLNPDVALRPAGITPTVGFGGTF